MYTKLLLQFWLLAAMAGAAMAQSCSFSNTGVDFGNVNLLSGGFQSATGTFAANCTGTPGRSITICPNFNEGSGGISPTGSSRYLRQGSNIMLYDLFKSNGIGQTWGSYTWGFPSRPKVMSVSLNGSGFGSTSETINARLFNQQIGVPTGTFSSIFSGQHTQIDYGYSPGFSCSATLSSRVQNVPFIVRTTNRSTCSVSATDMNFGNQTNLSSAVTSTNSISVTCTAGTQYDIGLSGTSAGSPMQWRMTNAATNSSVLYSIYRDAGRIQNWGNVIGSNTLNGVGNGANQNYTGYGRVPAQATPPSLTYTDNVIVTITY